MRRLLRECCCCKKKTRKNKEGSRQADIAVINSKKANETKTRHLCKGTEIEINSWLFFFVSAALPAEGRFTQTDLCPSVCLAGCLFKRQLPAAKMIFCTFGGKVGKKPLASSDAFPCTRFYRPCVCVHYIPLSALPFPLPLPLAIKPERALLTCCAISQVVEENRLVKLRYLNSDTAEQKSGLPIN